MISKTAEPAKRPVRIWLVIGLTMIFVQVVLGGITRLTGSGLSITKWDIVTGIVPPLTSSDWKKEYALYQQTPQYAKINKDMTLASFKRIFFWEYFHRLWARSMGFVFIIPLVYFLRKRWVSPGLKIDLWVVFLLASVVAAFGWIMVASGLINRPWVNAYKLMIHLSLAILLFEYLLITYLKVSGISSSSKVSDPFGKSSVMVRPLLVLVAVQVMLGGLMSGMKAGFAYPTFPMMNGEWLPSILFDSSQWTLNNMKEYDSGNMFAPALIQVLHRLMAYTIFVLGIIFGYRAYKHRVNGIFRFSVRLFLSLLIVQVVLGIFTLLGCQSGKVPLTLGVMHQAVGLLTLSAIVFVWYLKTHLAQYR